MQNDRCEQRPSSSALLDDRGQGDRSGVGTQFMLYKTFGSRSTSRNCFQTPRLSGLSHSKYKAISAKMFP